MVRIETFNKKAEVYDKWFDEHPRIYQSEVAALEKFVPWSGVGLEIGVGTGRFAAPLHIQYGIDPSLSTARIARDRGVSVIIGRGEDLPFCDASFDYVVMATVIHFLDDLLQVLTEVYRVLLPNGMLIIAFIDRDSPLGIEYRNDKESRPFFKDATFYSVEDLRSLAILSGFIRIEVTQSIFEDYGITPSGFVIIKGKKKRQSIRKK